MIDIFKQWLLTIMAMAIVVAVAHAVTPEGPVKRIVRFVGGMVLIITIINPLIEIRLESLSSYISQYTLKADFESSGIEIESARILQLIIEEKTQAYILDKANNIGLECRVEVECEFGENAYPYPYKVTIYASPTPAQKKGLTEIIEANLAVPAERQEWMQM